MSSLAAAHIRLDRRAMKHPHRVGQRDLCVPEDLP